MSGVSDRSSGMPAAGVVPGTEDSDLPLTVGWRSKRCFGRVVMRWTGTGGLGWRPLGAVRPCWAEMETHWGVLRMHRPLESLVTEAETWPTRSLWPVMAKTEPTGYFVHPVTWIGRSVTDGDVSMIGLRPTVDGNEEGVCSCWTTVFDPARPVEFRW